MSADHDEQTCSACERKLPTGSGAFALCDACCLEYDADQEAEERRIASARAAAQLADPDSGHCRTCPHEFTGQLDRYPNPHEPDGPLIYCIDCWVAVGYGQLEHRERTD